MTNHFNNLTEAEQERLAILVEECAEVIQAGCKILRHGNNRVNPKAVVAENEFPETNSAALERELGDLWHAVVRMGRAADLSLQSIHARADSKAEHVKPYLHHQDGRL